MVVSCGHLAAQGGGRGIRSTTALCGCLLRGRRGDTAGLAGRERAAQLRARPATSSSRSAVPKCLSNDALRALVSPSVASRSGGMTGTRRSGVLGCLVRCRLGFCSGQASLGRGADRLRRSCPGPCCRSSCRSCWSFWRLLAWLSCAVLAASWTLPTRSAAWSPGGRASSPVSGPGTKPGRAHRAHGEQIMTHVTMAGPWIQGSQRLPADCNGPGWAAGHLPRAEPASLTGVADTSGRTTRFSLATGTARRSAAEARRPGLAREDLRRRLQRLPLIADERAFRAGVSSEGEEPRRLPWCTRESRTGRC